MFRRLLLLLITGLVLGSSFVQIDVLSVADEPSADEPSTPATKVATDHLPNVYRVHESVLSGGLPEGEEAFAELARLGVKTIISVDGATPDVATAKKHGLRYVHLPFGYDGIPAQRAMELAKAVRDLSGPIYIHCHHGKHRSPAAASVACVGAGIVSPGHGEAILRMAGTSEDYHGLYAAARTARPFEKRALDSLECEFPEIAQVPPLAEAMVAAEHVHDHLQSIAKAGWRAPADHPDLDAAHEALLLRELFTELQRIELVDNRPQRFHAMLSESERLTMELERRLKWLSGSAPTSTEREKLSEILAQVTSTCTACHVQFRDNPGQRRQQ